GTAVTGRVREMLSEVGGAMRRDPPSAGRVAREGADRLEGAGAVEAAFALRRLGAAAAELADATVSLLAEVGEPGSDGAASDTTADTSRSAESREDEDTAQEADQRDEHRMRPTTRAAIQVACAGAAAIFFGELVSSTRWYWAVITAFVVFAGTGSRGELLIKAWRRTVGTLLGVIAGVGVAVLVSGYPMLQLAAVLCCVFLGFYLV